MPKQCWTAWVPSEAGMWYHWNSFRGSWGIWHPQLQSRRSDCFIWDHFSTGYTPGSQGWHGTTVNCDYLAVSPLPQPLDRPFISTGRGAPRTSVPAYCCHNRCLQHGLGRYMQRAGSLGALDRGCHPQPWSVCARYCGPPRCSGRPVPGKAWSHREVPEGCQEDEPLHATPCALLGPLYRPGWTSEGPLWAAGLSRAEIPVC